MAAVRELASKPAVPGVRSRPDPRHGVFETLLVVDGRPIELDAHLARLEASLTELFPDRPAPDLAVEVEACASDVDLGAVRVTAMPTGESELRSKVEPRQAVGPFMSLSGRKAPSAVAAHGLAVPGGLGAHKWADRSLLERAQAGLAADALPLIVDEDGTVLEASRANVFAVRGEALLTPPADGRILPGVTRMRVIELARAIEVEIREVEISREDLFDADEVFLTGSVRGVERVRAVDGAAVSSDGDVADRLAGELRLAWAGAKFG